MTEIFTANTLAAAHIKANLAHKKKAYVIGREVLVQEIKTTGLEVVPASEHDDKYGNISYEDQGDMKFHDIDLVVMGYDDKINYFKMAFAFYALQVGVRSADLGRSGLDQRRQEHEFLLIPDDEDPRQRVFRGGDGERIWQEGIRGGQAEPRDFRHHLGRAQGRRVSRRSTKTHVCSSETTSTPISCSPMAQELTRSLCSLA